jgi:Stress responsive A/B Barrel Domain
MIKHIVLFKFKPEAAESDIADLEKSLNALPDLINDIISFSCGRDLLHTERSYDLALVADLADLEALNRYQIHPDHQAVVAKVKRIASNIVAVDYPC